jgi:hypothetical protein
LTGSAPPAGPAALAAAAAAAARWAAGSGERWGAGKSAIRYPRRGSPARAFARAGLFFRALSRAAPEFVTRDQ